MGQPASLHFLGWESSPLEAAARWLLALKPEDLAQRLVALPGGRAGRRLLAKLAAEAPPDWIPPRILTQGALVDALVQLEAPAAGRLTRTLAWAEALRRAPAADQQCLLARPPQDLAGWLPLAERVRSLHAELAVEGRDFAWMADQLEQAGELSEARRWSALAAAQQAFRERLEQEGLLDPHEARLGAAMSGQVHSQTSVVLVGLSDVGGLLGQALDALEQSPDALVFAPESEAAGFDRFGSVQTEYWLARSLPLDLERWHVVASPAGQVEAALSATAERATRGAVSFGMCDDEITPLLAERLKQAKIGTRIAAGTALVNTRPHALLRNTASFLEELRQGPLAALVRHPDLGAYLMSKQLGTRPVIDLDRHFREHLPWRIDGDNPPLGQRKIREPMEQLRASLAHLLGDLSSTDPRSLPSWSEPIRLFLATIYGAIESPRDMQDSAADVLNGALDAIAETLSSWDELPASIAPKLSAGEALAMLLDGLKAASIPPAARAAFDAETDLLGWLELPLDDAETLVLTGVQDGRVPESVRGDSFLPDALRARLGLVDDARRMARDLYTLTLLHHSRELVLISGRRAQGGEALQASRLLFHATPAFVVERMNHFLGSKNDPIRHELSEVQAGAIPADSEPAFVVPEAMSVTAFRNYLESPRRFHLDNVLGLKTLDDRAREMDPLLFGNILHAVVECLGTPHLSSCADEPALQQALQEELVRVALRTFGPEPLPAVRLQLAQMDYRLSILARRQAEWIASGWRVKHVEWPEPAKLGIPMAVDDSPMSVRGRIDRIDYNEITKKWAILDYKTGASGLNADSTHRSKDGTWKDLQLPLYTHLTESLDIGEIPLLGYIYLGRKEQDIGFRIAKKLTEDVVGEAFTEAHNVVRKVREGEVEDIGKWKPKDPIFAGIVGMDLLESEENQETEQ